MRGDSCNYRSSRSTNFSTRHITCYLRSAVREVKVARLFLFWGRFRFMLVVRCRWSFCLLVFVLIRECWGPDMGRSNLLRFFTRTRPVLSKIGSDRDYFFGVLFRGLISSALWDLSPIRIFPSPMEVYASPIREQPSPSKE